MKRKGLSWDGGKKRIIAVAMMLSVLAAPGVANAAPVKSDKSTTSISVEVEAPIVGINRIGVSWS